MKPTVIKAEFRYTLRRLRRSPLLASSKVIILAVGIGCFASIFSAYNSFMLKALPYADSDRLVVVGQSQASSGPDARTNVNHHSYEGVKLQSTTLESIGNYFWRDRKVLIDGNSHILLTAATSANYFEVLKPELLLGTYYQEENALLTEPRPLVADFRFWTNYLNSDPNVLGREIILNDRHHRIVGVTQKGFQIPEAENSENPFYLYAPMAKEEHPPERLKSRWFPSVGRLAPGAELGHLQSELVNIDASVRAEWPMVMRGKAIVAFDLREHLTRGYRQELHLLLSAAALICTIACINLVILSLGQATVLARKQSIKNSLGGRWSHLAFGILLENTALMFVATGLGVFSAALITKAVASQIENLPVSISTGDTNVLIASFALGLCICIVTTLATLVYLSGQQQTASNQSSPRVLGNRIGKALVITEIAASSLALVLVGLFLSSGINRLNLPRAIDVDQLYSLAVLPNADTHPKVEDRFRFFMRTLDQLESLPGVESAAFGPMAPFEGNHPYPFIDDFDEVTMNETKRSLRRQSVSPSYFSTMGLNLVRGRLFDERDNEIGAPRTFVVNQAAADLWWPDSDPIGRRIKINHRTDVEWAEIIGICENQYSGSDNPSQLPFGFRPTSNYIYQMGRIAIRMESAGTVLSLEDVERKIRAVDPDARMSWFMSASDFFSQSQWFSTTLTKLLFVFASFVVLLATMGFLSFHFFKLSRSSSEFGLRIALGATRDQLRRMLLGRSLLDGLAGFCCGGFAAFSIGRQFQEYLYETNPFSPSVYVAALCITCTITLTGALYPVLFFTQGNLTNSLRKDD